MSEDQIKQAEELKGQANKHFLAKEWNPAIELYSKAIELNGNNHVLYANRAACQIHLEAYGAAITDANKAIELDPTYTKGYYRRGCAYIALIKYKDALKDFAKVAQMKPKDKGARRRYTECKKAIRREAFEKAIACENSKPMSETLAEEVENLNVPGDYDGLKVDQELGPAGITLDWIQQLIEFFTAQKKLATKYVIQIMLHAKSIFEKLPSLVDIKVPEDGCVTVFGDVHGQLYDVANALKLCGLPSEKNYILFNGDLVDRGSWSFEVIMLAFSMKCAFPDYVHIARGNHEAKSMNKVYGFEDEVKAKYNERIFECFLEIFCALPLAHLIENKIFICHGGLFQEDDVTISDIRKINRFREPPEDGLMCDVLWSDPSPVAGRSRSKRGVGIGFGPDITKAFLDRNNLDLVVRSHEVRQNGYSVEHDGKLVTIFSAPNYCDQSGNKAAFIKFHSDLKPQFTTYAHVEHPPMKPMAYSKNMYGL